MSQFGLYFLHYSEKSAQIETPMYTALILILEACMLSFKSTIFGIFMLILFGFGGITSAQANPLHLISERQSFSHSAQNSLDWVGIYQGNLPCANCSEIQVTLTLQPNGQYQKVADYIGNNGGVFVTKGKFKWLNSGQIIQLFENGKLQEQYFVAENELKQLDNQGKPLSGPFASLYTLNKQ
jgi:uncharacterized lipoprotein NlpE involved in copper resistance